MGDYQGLIVGVVLLLLNAFFVGAEFAVISARRSAIEPKAEAGSQRARWTISAMEQVSEMLAVAQLGITMCSLGLGAVAEPALAHLLEPWLHRVGLPDSWLHPVAFTIALTLVVYLHVVVGEMIPKNLALSVSDSAAMALAPALLLVSIILRPVIWTMNTIANGFLRVCGVKPKDEVESAFTAAQVQSIVAESQKEGLIESDTDLLTGALEFSDRTALDVMVPTADLVTLPEHVTPAECERAVTSTGFSRFPIGGADGAFHSYLHLKDVLYADDAEWDEPVPAKRRRSLVTIQANDEIEDALAEMQQARAHLGRVVDPNGATLGIIFMEDVIEELVGEISDATRRQHKVSTEGVAQ